MTNERLTKAQRLSESPVITDVRRKGERLRIGPFVVSRRENRLKGPRLAIMITRQAGSSVSRNAAKRQIREFFRRNKELLGCFDYVVFSSRKISAFNGEKWKHFHENILKWHHSGGS